MTHTPQKNHLVGLFVVGALVLFGIGLFVIGDLHQLFSHHREYYSEFVNLAGLSNGAKVRVAGMDAGQVMAIAVHTYISGVPHRIKYFERVLQNLKKQDGVVFWTGEQILEWYEGAAQRSTT